MADILVFSKNCDDFGTLGECGPLTPLKDGARFVEEANGTSELTVKHPIDELGRWRFLQDGYLLEAEVPVRTTPEIKDGAIVTSIEQWHVRPTATKDQRGVYSKATGGKRYKVLAVNAPVYVVDKGDSRYKIKWKKGFGWISIAAIQYDLTPTPLAGDPEAIESAVPAWSVRPQLFRIYSVDVNPGDVTVKARHVSFDLLGNLTTYTADNPTAQAALQGILSGCCKAHDFVGRSNVLDQRVISDWTRISPIEALTNPETGLTAVWGADLIRDNWELTVLDDAGMHRGVRIAYGKNLTGVQCAVDTSTLITSILPVGQTNKGKPLLLASGSYAIGSETVVVDASLTVRSPHASDYPVPHVFEMDVGSAAKAASGKAADVLAARKKMIAAALDKFRQAQCDLPLLSLKVSFIALGDTVEGRQYRELENVYLFDRVGVWHPRIGVDLLTAVNRVEFDPVDGRFVGLELGAVRRDPARIKAPAWQLPAVTNVAYGAVGAGALAEDVGETLDMTGNPAVWQVAVTSSAGPVSVGIPFSPTTLTATVVVGGADKTGDIDAARFVWARASGDAASDAAWASAHAGTKAVVLTAAERAVDAAYTCSIEGEEE